VNEGKAFEMNLWVLLVFCIFIVCFSRRDSGFL